MSHFKRKKDIDKMREAGKRLSKILDSVVSAVSVGESAKKIDDLAEKLIRDGGDEPAFLNYKPFGARRKYPATLCVSFNNEVVHGIPNEQSKIFKNGDIVGIDIGLVHNGFYVDMARTIGVGTIDDKAKKLIDTTRESLNVAIASCKNGSKVGDIGSAIKNYVKPFGYGIVQSLGGHGVGRALHEMPYISNVGVKGSGDTLMSGMTIAIEPMLNEGSPNIDLDDDGFTIKTTDGKRSAHFEHTILITDDGAEILTK